MAIDCGFYNSVNKDRLYDATQFSKIFDGIINDGIYMSVLNHFAVRSAGNGMTIIVGGGRAWFNHTWTYNDSDYSMVVDESEFVANRIDAVVLKIDTRDSARINTVEIIKGTPAETPVKPEFPDGGGVFYHPLAYITVNAAVTEITAADIENAIGVDSRTPFVTGIIETIDASELYQSWQYEWESWNDEHRQEYLDWVQQQESDMANWTVEQQVAYTTWISTQEAAFETWMSEQQADFVSWENANKTAFENWEDVQKTSFEAWVETLHGILDDETAGHLQNEIEDLDEELFKRYYELCSRNTSYTYNSDGDIIGWTSTSDDVTLETTISWTPTQKTIVTEIDDGTYIWTKTSVIDRVDHTTTESYTKEDKA